MNGFFPLPSQPLPVLVLLPVIMLSAVNSLNCLMFLLQRRKKNESSIREIGVGSLLSCSVKRKFFKDILFQQQTDMLMERSGIFCLYILLMYLIFRITTDQLRIFLQRNCIVLRWYMLHLVNFFNFTMETTSPSLWTCCKVEKTSFADNIGLFLVVFFKQEPQCLKQVAFKKWWHAIDCTFLKSWLLLFFFLKAKLSETKVELAFLQPCSKTYQHFQVQYV